MRLWLRAVALVLLSGWGGLQAGNTGMAVNGSDSTVYTNDSLLVCDNVFPLHYGDTTFYAGTKSGVYPVRFVAGVNRDSIVRLHLTVLPSYKVYDTLLLCQGDLPFYYGSVQISSTTPVGTHSRIIPLKTVKGCDSTVFLQLTVYPSYYSNDQIRVCENRFPIQFGGRQITAAGSYSIIMRSVNGCDSNIRLVVSTDPVYHRYDTVRICPSSLPYSYGGRWFTQGGEYQIDNITYRGCDSIVHLSLQVYTYPLAKDTLHLCQSAFPYRYGNIMIMNEGTFKSAFRSKEGCDSLVEVTAYVAQSYVVPHNLHLCTNDLPYEYGDRKITDTGSYVVPMRSMYGCDSVIHLHVTIGHPSHTALVDTICWGEPYNRNGYHLPPMTAFDDYYIVHGRKPAANMEGCDSNFTLTIRIMPVYENSDTLLVCDGDLPIRRHGQAFAAAGTYEVRLQTVHGCDSIINFCLQTTKSYHMVRTEHFCAGTTYKVGDSIFKESGVYQVVMRTKGGCDSIVDLTLVKDDRAPYNPGQIYAKKDLYETDKHTFWISSVPNASFYRWSYSNPNWLPIGGNTDYVYALHNMLDGDTGTVSVVAGNACGLSAASKISVNVTALFEAEGAESIRLYPNPTSDRLTVETGDSPATRIEFCDMAGRVMFDLPVTDSRTDITLQRFSAGYYIVRVWNGRQIVKVLPLVKR